MAGTVAGGYVVRKASPDIKRFDKRMVAGSEQELAVNFYYCDETDTK
jgi:hypothetical protein